MSSKFIKIGEGYIGIDPNFELIVGKNIDGDDTLYYQWLQRKERRHVYLIHLQSQLYLAVNNDKPYLTKARNDDCKFQFTNVNHNQNQNRNHMYLQSFAWQDKYLGNVKNQIVIINHKTRDPTNCAVTLFDVNVNVKTTQITNNNNNQEFKIDDDFSAEAVAKRKQMGEAYKAEIMAWHRAKGPNWRDPYSDRNINPNADQQSISRSKQWLREFAEEEARIYDREHPDKKRLSKFVTDFSHVNVRFVPRPNKSVDKCLQRNHQRWMNSHRKILREQEFDNSRSIEQSQQRKGRVETSQMFEVNDQP